MERSAILARCLAAADVRINRTCGRTFLDRTPEGGDDPVDPETVVYRPQRFTRVLLLNDDLHTLTAVTSDGASLELTGVRLLRYTTDIVFPYRAIARTDGSSWGSEVAVAGRWGWQSVPAGVQQAAVMIAARLYQRMQSLSGVAQSADVVGAEQTWMVPRYDFEAMALLKDYCAGRAV